MYRMVHVSFWQDADLIEATPEEKYFFLYILTNPHTSQCGIYEISKRTMAFETGYNIETIDKLLTRFAQQGRLYYDESTKELLVTKWLKHNWSESPKVKKRIAEELSAIKSKKLLLTLHNLYPDKIKELERYGYSMDSLSIDYPYSIDSLCIDSSEKEKEKEKEKKEKKEKEKEYIEHSSYEECLLEQSSNSPDSERQKVPYKQIQELYNTICSDLPKCTELTDMRKKLLRARWKQYPNLEFWRAFFERVQASDFLCGRTSPPNGRPPFVADFTWIIRPENFQKIIEGKYDNRKTAKEIEEEEYYEQIRRKLGI